MKTTDERGRGRRSGKALRATKTRRFQRDMSTPLQDWRFEVGRSQEGQRLDAYLAARLRWRSRGEIQRVIAEEQVELERSERVAGDEVRRRLRPSTRLRRGDAITVWLAAAQEQDRMAQDRAAQDGPACAPGLGKEADELAGLEIVYQDDRLVAVNKPPFMNTYPSRRHRSRSLLEVLHRQLHESLGDDFIPPSPCHRLDRETSGLLVLANDVEARAHLGDQFERRTLDKTYLAMVVGSLEDDAGKIDLPLGPHPSSRLKIKMAVRHDQLGQAARTAWRVRSRQKETTLLEVSPATGRQHQIRAHLAAIGHPLVGDLLYGAGDEAFLRSFEEPGRGGPLQRHALHAWRLELTHPDSAAPDHGAPGETAPDHADPNRATRGTGTTMILEAPLWPDIEAALSSSSVSSGSSASSGVCCPPDRDDEE